MQPIYHWAVSQVAGRPVRSEWLRHTKRPPDKIGFSNLTHRELSRLIVASLRRMAARPAKPDPLQMSKPDLTVYHDGSCPLCRLEIEHYRKQTGAEAIDFVDVSDPANDPGPGISRQDAMGRFHVRLPSGQLMVGGRAFIEIWKVLPRWRSLARAARVPGMMGVLDVGYRLFLPIRPSLAWIVGRFSSR